MVKPIIGYIGIAFGPDAFGPVPIVGSKQTVLYATADEARRALTHVATARGWDTDDVDVVEVRDGR